MYQLGFLSVEGQALKPGPLDDFAAVPFEGLTVRLQRVARCEETDVVGVPSS
jgi:hypothetical protein